jgi:glucose/arabinose dehydrogenase
MNKCLSVPALATGIGLLLATSTLHAQIPQKKKISLETVATELTAPNWGTVVPGCPELENRLVVSDQNGILWGIDTDSGEKTVLLDVSERLVRLGVGGEGTFDERGFLGVALHPEFADNGLLYTYTSEPVAGDADFSTMPDGEEANHQSVINEWQVVEPPCAPESVVDPATVRELMRIDEPQFNHDAGALAFGPDEMLYISLGDGGMADDQGVGHVEGGNGQDPSNILGSIVRIDPLGTDSRT